jgi:VWFA-related protein
MNSPEKKCLLLATLLAIGIAAASPLPLKPGPERSFHETTSLIPQKPIQHEAGVALKLIQVVVLDKKGNPVTDLVKGDFVLTDNGQAMALTEFERHALKIPSGEEPPAEARLAETPLPQKPALLNRKLFFVFDFGYSDAQGIVLARKAALKFLETGLFPTDEISVLTYSLFGRLKIREFLTTSRAKARQAVEKIGLADALGTVDEGQGGTSAGDLANARTATTPNRASEDPSGGGAGESAPSSGSDARLQARMYITHLTSLAQALRHVPGQKVFVLFSKGIPYPLIYRKDLNADLRDAHEALLAKFATSNIVVYPIDTTELDVGALAAPESSRGAATLRRVAQATGGEYLGVLNNPEGHFQRLQTLTAAYYVLGYPVDEAWDGKYHKIKVAVNRPGLEVRAQAGYLNPQPFSAFTKIERDLHLVDLALSEKPLGQVPLRFSVAPLLTGLGRDGGMCLVARLPFREMREKWTGGPVEVLGLVYDRNDEVVAMTRSEERPAGIKEEAAYLAAWETVPPGTYRCRIAVRDLETGAAAVGAASIAVPEAAPVFRLRPPLFLRPERAARYINQGTSPSSAKKAGRDDLAKAFVFDPVQYSPNFDARLAKKSEIWAVVPSEGPEGFGEGLRLTARLLDKLDGDEIPVSLTVVGKTEKHGIVVFFVRLEIPEVEPDEYGLIITAEGKDGRTSTLAKDFIIE